uniref:Uncharacterized protein n=1 Tax=Rhizophora mucronata TaxID=61149 RepID=A0A2P2NNJ3_RHIMU
MNSKQISNVIITPDLALHFQQTVRHYGDCYVRDSL